MKFHLATAEIYIPDQIFQELALSRTTHLCFVAHQDDKWFIGGSCECRKGQYDSKHRYKLAYCFLTSILIQLVHTSHIRIHHEAQARSSHTSLSSVKKCAGRRY